MFEFFANLFGYLLQLLYELVNNYGVAIILFTVIIKLLLLPLSIKQQRTMKKSTELQEKMKVIQFKYKSDPEKMNQEMMNLYKSENMSPFSGCLTAIIQLLLLLSIFYLVRSPLTYMEKIPQDSINHYVQQLQENGKTVSQVYPEIDLIRESSWLKEQNPEDTNVDRLNLQMNFLGLDLSKVPQQNMTDYTVYIIPVLYILSSFISIRMNTAMQAKKAKQNKEEKEPKDIKIDGTTGKELVPQEEENNEMDAVMQTNKMMSWMMPIMSISIAFIAPLAKTIISEGKTTNEAIEKGLKELNVSRKMVDIKVLENEDKRSFFSILAPRVVKVEMTLKESSVEKHHEIKPKKEIVLSEEEQEKAKENIEKFLIELKPELPEDTTYSIKTEKNAIYVYLNSPSLGFLIGYRGETLYAMQNILTAIAGKGIENKVRVILDIEGYKAKREKTLEDLAEKVAKTVIRTGKPVKLEPMQAYERKIIHTELQGNDKVETNSIGEEPYRRIVISLKK